MKVRVALLLVAVLATSMGAARAAEVALPPFYEGVMALLCRLDPARWAPRVRERIDELCVDPRLRMSFSVNNSTAAMLAAILQAAGQHDEAFDAWFSALRDRAAARRIQARIDRAEAGNLGDCAPVGGGVSEMRIHHGPGYRVYFVQRGLEVIVLLGGGDKSTQSRDIASAIELVKQL